MAGTEAVSAPGDPTLGRTAAVGPGEVLELLGSGPAAEQARCWQRLGALPFDHDRQLASVVVADASATALLVVKGEPERLLDRCVDVGAGVRASLDALFDTGARVIGVATRPAGGLRVPTAQDEHGLRFEGLLVFSDRPKADAAASLARLAALEVTVKVLTGDSERVARKVCGDLGLDTTAVLTGEQVAALSDEALAAAVLTTTVFARVAPDQKARIVRSARAAGGDVGFLGDGVNDAVALHHADVGISVDTATDVAKDAADVLLLDKDLGVLADGVVEGRRIFANTVKYVLMATSSNFGNMFSAAGASLFLSYLPMLPTQLLLNNLLYDAGQMTIPTDAVDEEMLTRPAQWDIAFIRRFMAVFGPISSVFDVLTFLLLLGPLHAGREEFRTGWFVESLATQTLVIFVIRTRRVPFLRSRPSRPLLVAILATAATGALLPFTPLARVLGFTPLPAAFFALLLGLVLTYLLLAELTKSWFYAAAARAAARPARALGPRRHAYPRRVHRRAARFTHARPVVRSPGATRPGGRALRPGPALRQGRP